MIEFHAERPVWSDSLDLYARQLERELRQAEIYEFQEHERAEKAESALASLADELRLAREALKQAAEMLQASLPYWQTDERGNGPDCTPVLQAILKANAALKEPL